MKIEKIIRASGSNFKAMCICEFCGHKKTMYGFSESYYKNTIRYTKCEKCEKSTNEMKPPMDVRDFFRLAKEYCEAHECEDCKIRNYCIILTNLPIVNTFPDAIAALREWEASHE